MLVGAQKGWKANRRPQIVKAIPVVTEHGRFASHREAQRWHISSLRQARGEINNLERDVQFRIELNGHHIITIIAHQAYFEGPRRVAVFIGIEDSEAFEIKSRLLEAINVKVVRC